MARAPHLPRRWHGLLDAVAFLTVLPVTGAARRQQRFDLSPALPWFPLIGGLVGAAGGALRFGLDPLVGRGPSTVITLAALVLITGALHQDALADACDGLGVRGDRARRLAVMREPTLGAFGVTAVILWALLLLSSLEQLSANRAFATLVSAEALARLAAVFHARGTRPARPDGLGAGLRAGWPEVLIATAVGGAIAVLAAGPARAGLALGISALLAGFSALLARGAVGGSTGDTLGATVALTEALTCMALVAAWR